MPPALQFRHWKLITEDAMFYMIFIIFFINFCIFAILYFRASVPSA